MRPPPIVLLVVAFEAGLATGLSHFLAPILVIPLLTVTGILLSRRGSDWIPWTALLGVGLGIVGRSAAFRSCAAQLPAQEMTLTIALREPVESGLAEARVLQPSCPGTITIRVRGEQLLPAGSRWSATGRWIPSRRLGGRPDGIFVVQRLSNRGGTPEPSDRLRTWTTRTIASLYGQRAGLVEALLVGRRGGIDPGLNAAFARSGLVHLLSISGFHVGIVFGWVTLILRGLTVRRGAAGGIAAGVVFGYVAFLGWPAPALRAAFLAGLGAWCIMRQRHPAAIPLLAATCLGVTLVDPWAIFDLGGWLSAAAFWGALGFTRWSDRALGERAGWRMLFASLGATLSTAPLTAAGLGAVALAGIALNFVAVPLAAVAVPAVLASVLLYPLVGPVAGALAAGGGLGLAALEALARAGSRLPFGAVQMVPGPAAALPWLGVLGVVLWAFGQRNTSRRALLRLGWAAGALGVVTLAPLPHWFSTDGGSGLALHFLSVGQGDATAIRTPAGRWVLVDAGPADERRNAGRDVVAPFLIRHGVKRLAAFVLSHPHLDHDGGAPVVLRDFSADVIIDPAHPVVEPHYFELLDLAAERGMRWRPGRAGDSLLLDGVRFDVLHPDTTWSGWGNDINDDSVVLRLRYGAFEAILAGDLGVRAESLLAGKVGAAELLKVGHHGSAGSSGTPWLREIGAQVAVIEVGPNRYGHPSPETLGRLAEAGAEVFRTDRDGTVVVLVAESTMTVRSRRGAKTFPLRP